MTPQQLILVDDQDNRLGALERELCHDGDGLLHRAFSIFVFDADGRALLQRRSATKRLWPLHWSNSCCGHPLDGESTAAAAERRIEEELGFQTTLVPRFRFQYRARFGDLGSEHELCTVFCGRYSGRLQPDPSEIAEWRWVEPAEVDRELDLEPDRFTPWFRIAWPELTLEQDLSDAARDGH